MPEPWAVMVMQMISRFPAAISSRKTSANSIRVIWAVVGMAAASKSMG